MRKFKMGVVALGIVLAATCFNGCAIGKKSTNNVTTENDETKDAEQETKKEKEPSEKELYAPKFSVQSGFYANKFDLEITSDNPEAQIYYTTDGSTPTTESTLYTGPFSVKARSGLANTLSAVTKVNPDEDYVPQGKVDKATVIRAIAVMPDGSTSWGSQATYLVGIDADKYANVPIVSLTTEKENLFNYDTGIYVLGKAYDEWLKEDPNNINKNGWEREANFTQRGIEWERPGMVEYIPNDGTEGFSQEIGMRIMGAASRSGTQKSFRITARDSYGRKNIQFEILPNNLRSDMSGNVTKYKSFILRNGGNDKDTTKLRDPFLQSLVADRHFDTYQTQPVVVFLDGEFWGMYTLCEDYNDNYVENNYGIDNDNVIVVKKREIEDGNEEDIALYNEMYDFIVNHDMAVAVNYKKACDYLDMQSFAEYLAFDLYVYNQDSLFEDNNWEMWRVREVDPENPYADGRWRMMLYDTEYSTGIYDGGGNFKTNNIIKQLRGQITGNEWYRPARDMFVSLSKNKDFKQLMVLALCDLRNINFEKTHALAELDKMAVTYGALAPMTWERFGPYWITYDPNGRFWGELDNLKKFLEGRYDNFMPLVRTSYALSKEVNVKLEKVEASKGAVMMNTTMLNLSEEFSGHYFKEYPITLTAVPADGAKFVRWEGTGVDLTDTTSSTIEVKLDGNCRIKAVFE